MLFSVKSFTMHQDDGHFEMNSRTNAFWNQQENNGGGNLLAVSAMGSQKYYGEVQVPLK